jgi:hypothetical protein
LALIIILSFSFLLIKCASEEPTPALIEKAKIQTMSIIDSLNQDSTTVIGDVNMISEYFDKDKNQYVINYRIETGLDSSGMANTNATVFINKKNGRWGYNFVFDKSYKRKLSLK